MKTKEIKKPKKAIGYIMDYPDGSRVFKLYQKFRPPTYVRFPYKD